MNDQCTWQRSGGRCLRDAGHPGPHRSQADYAAMPANGDDEAAIRDALAHNTDRRTCAGCSQPGDLTEAAWGQRLCAECHESFLVWRDTRSTPRAEVER